MVVLILKPSETLVALQFRCLSGDLPLRNKLCRDSCLTSALKAKDAKCLSRIKDSETSLQDGLCADESAWPFVEPTNGHQGCSCLTKKLRNMDAFESICVRGPAPSCLRESYITVTLG